MSTPEPVEPVPPPTTPGGFFRDLFDLRFRTLMAVRMLPVVYGVGIAVAATFTLYVVARAFKDSVGDGLTWLVLLGPVMFIGLVLALRITLEVVLAFFRMAFYIEHVATHTAEMSKDMPKFGWWRSLLFGQNSSPSAPPSKPPVKKPPEPG